MKKIMKTKQSNNQRKLICRSTKSYNMLVKLTNSGHGHIQSLEAMLFFEIVLECKYRCMSTASSTFKFLLLRSLRTFCC